MLLLAGSVKIRLAAILNATAMTPTVPPKEKTESTSEDTENKKSVDDDTTTKALFDEFDAAIRAMGDHAQEIILKFISMMQERGVQYFQNLLVSAFILLFFFAALTSKESSTAPINFFFSSASS